jgi:hypothetical protein
LIYAAAARRAADGPHLLGFSAPVADSARAWLLRSEVPKELLEELLRGPPDSMYWLSESDEARLGGNSAAFARDLAAKCAWDDAAERAAIAGRRPFEDLKPMWACRTRIAQAQARTALHAALHAQ